MLLVNHSSRENQTVDEPISSKIITTVAALKGSEPIELDSLYNAIDPDALDALFAPTNNPHARQSGFVEFQYCGHQITAKANGRVLIDGEDADLSLELSSAGRDLVNNG